MANGDTIKQVKELLENPKAMTGKTAQILTLTLLADLYEKWEADHNKMETLWPAFVWGRWGVLLIAALLVTDFVTRFLGLLPK
jgi:hypothetical protein